MDYLHCSTCNRMALAFPLHLAFLHSYIATHFIRLYFIELCLLQKIGLSIYASSIHSKSEKVCGTAFSVKKYCGKSAGHFWATLGHFGSFWAFLGHFGSYLCHFGPFGVIFGPFRGIFGQICGKFNFFAALLESRNSLLECMASSLFVLHLLFII